MSQNLPQARYLELILLLLRQRKRLRVTGNSMMPLLKPGDEIILNPHAYVKAPPKVGDIVVARHPQQELKIIKRVAVIELNGDCFLLGDNPLASTDSRHWGTVNYIELAGKVTSIF